MCQRMGTSIGWDGVPRVRDVTDVARIYPNIAPQHLLHLLSTTLNHLSTSSGARPTLLHQVYGVFNPCSGVQQKRYTELSSKFVELLGKFRAANHLSTKSFHRITFLERALLKAAEGDSDGDFEALVPDMHTISDDVIPVLQSVGRAKELAHLQTQTQANKNTCDLLKVEIDALTSDMARLGCLVSGINRGHLDGPLCWLQARELGLASMGCGSGVAAGRAFVPSAASLQTKLTSKYRLLWTVSGHMMNPAYCCVFDQTGRYILSGADDYLVKIWDVATGQLIRTCKGHMGYISLVAVSPDNSLFASACTMGTIRIWRLSDGLCLQVLKHKASVNWIKFDRTSCALASASDDGHCIVWDLSKLLPEDSSEVPILDVIIENRHTALNAAHSSNAAAPRHREVDTLLDDALQMEAGGHSNGHGRVSLDSAEAADTAVASSSSTSHAYAGNHAGEARLLSAVTSSAAAVASGLRGQRGGASSAATGSAPSAGGVWGAPDHASASLAGPVHAPINPLNSRGGLFRWSGVLGGNSQEENEAMLALHHVEDMFQINRGGDPLKVQCLDVSPMGNILVTGCEDGVGRVWRIGDPEQLAGYSTRQVRLPIEETLMKLKVLCSPNEYERLRRVASHLLLRLEGHVSPITDIHLNHLGDRVLTGSAQDCSVRIWSLSRDHTKSVQIVLDLTEDEDGGADEGVQSRVRGGRNARIRLKSQLYNACWTCDSSKIVTIQSVVLPSHQPGAGAGADALPTRLKVWDAMTGDLLRVIWKVSDISCRSLCTHPLNPSVVATCGEDGYINVWDVDQEERLSCSRLFNDDKTTPSNIVDASFSDDGTRIAVTDFLGRLSVLGLEDPQRYEHVRSEQYFSTDYLDIMLDNTGFAIDVGTQLPVHEAPIGPLIRMDGTPYDAQPAPRRGPPPMAKSEVRDMQAEIAVDRKLSLKEMDRVFAIFTRNQSRGRLPRKYRGSKPKSIRHAEELARLQGASTAAPAQRESRVQYIEFDVNTYNPSTDESDDSEYGRERSPDISRPHRFREERGRREPREPRETRARVATLQSTSSSQRRSGRSRTQVHSYDDAIGLEDNEYTQGNTAQSRGVRARQREARRREQRVAEGDSSGSSAFDTEDSDSDNVVLLSSDEEVQRAGRRSGRARGSRRNGSSRNAVNVDDEDEGPLEELAPRPKKAKPAAFYQAKHGTVLSEGVEVGRRWLQSEELTAQYSPQLGDKVMYFPQGHIQWLQQFQESSSPPWMAFPQRWPIVECEVRDVQYVFPDTALEYKMCCSVKAKVLLAVVRVPLRHAITTHDQYVLEMVAPRATRHSSAKEITFTVTLRDWDMPDFLVPSDLFMRSIRLAWHKGIRVNVPFKDYSEAEKRYIFKTYYGQVEGINNASAEWPHSPWDCIQVAWDDTDPSSPDATIRVGPWEAIPQFDASSEYSRILAKFPLAKLDEGEAQRILQEIDALMADPKYANLFQPFAYEVDSSAFPSYYSSIPVPMCVELIRQRLINGYYRQVSSPRIEYLCCAKTNTCVVF
jgi:WD40 repeat protein